MRHFVLDCSFALAWALEEKGVETRRQTMCLVAQYGAKAPSIFVLEVANVLAQSARTPSHVDKVLSALWNIDITIEPQTTERVWNRRLALARRLNLSAYDAAYLELAIREEATLITLDSDLHRAARLEGVLTLPEVV